MTSLAKSAEATMSVLLFLAEAKAAARSRKSGSSIGGLLAVVFGGGGLEGIGGDNKGDRRVGVDVVAGDGKAGDMVRG